MPGTLQRDPKPVTLLRPLRAGGRRRQEGGQSLGLRIPLPDWRSTGTLASLVILAERKEPVLRPNAARLFHFRQPHCATVGPGTEEVDVDGRFAAGHPATECTAAGLLSRGMTSDSSRRSGSRSYAIPGT